MSTETTEAKSLRERVSGLRREPMFGLTTSNEEKRHYNKAIEDVLKLLPEADPSEWYHKTCIHHTDSERAKITCPVCLRSEVDRLRGLITRIGKTFDKDFDAFEATPDFLDRVAVSAERRAALLQKLVSANFCDMKGEMMARQIPELPEGVPPPPGDLILLGPEDQVDRPERNHLYWYFDLDAVLVPKWHRHIGVLRRNPRLLIAAAPDTMLAAANPHAWKVAAPDEENPHKLQDLVIMRESEGLGVPFRGPLMVISAAISVNGLVITAPRPARHHHLLAASVFELGLEANRQLRQFGHVQGFVLSDGTFADRKRAGEVAMAAGQIKEHRHKEAHLYSEDIW